MGSLTILGIDPGSQVTGYGVIMVDGAALRHVASGCIRIRGADMAARLRVIFDGAVRLVAEYHPDEICIERVFVHKNADSALKLGHARAAALCGTFSHPSPVHEYAPREIKLAVTGTGAADKTQVAHMVRRLLGVQGPMTSDASDALALAICHAHLRRSRALRAALAGAAR